MAAVKTVAAIFPAGRALEGSFNAVAEAARERGLAVARVDTEFSPDQKLGGACAILEGASVVVADVSARNPHVMFLAGYAVGIGRKVIFIALHREDFPFDHNRHASVIYNGNVEFLKSEMGRLFDGGQRTDQKEESARGRFEALFGEIFRAHGQEHQGEIVLENPTTFVLKDQELELALVQDLSRKARELGIRIKLM